ncbi:hypothetical protein PGT21_023743 [Puccinia graminis f. sp. tritici]|uniref:Uncharacterized protein n=1 Tax=Puccinia graminis f. sp. tritici TaxID=56615 RepID=A0A5B0RVE5_PUCGR|nr:hypothetical protein PGT21_023743 [Puccinia graminis f. sp. tritici]KAA1129075.1 hypothetical protein PGTUg99_027811 [Puccinia graminis f. sp. tritici]
MDGLALPSGFSNMQVTSDGCSLQGQGRMASGTSDWVSKCHPPHPVVYFRSCAKSEPFNQWYATSPILNSFLSLIRDFYNLKAIPLSAVHLTLDPVTLTFKTFVSLPIGLLTLQTLNLLFKPIPCSLLIPTPERTAMELLTKPILDSTAANQNIESNLKN